jgi:hypothetical protein
MTQSKGQNFIFLFLKKSLCAIQPKVKKTKKFLIKNTHVKIDQRVKNFIKN